MNWILDGAVLLVVVAFTAIFAIIGFSKSIFGFLSGVVALILAISFCSPLGHFVAEKWVTPAMSNFVAESFKEETDNYSKEEYGEEKSEEELEKSDFDKTIDSISGKLGAFMAVFGVDREGLKAKYDEAASYVKGKIAFFAESICGSVSEAIARVICFIVIFIVALILLKLLSLIFDKLFELPVLKQINHIGGALLGLILGIIAVLVLTAGFKLIQPNIRDKDENPVITEQHIDDTLVFKYFYNLKL